APGDSAAAVPRRLAGRTLGPVDRTRRGRGTTGRAGSTQQGRRPDREEAARSGCAAVAGPVVTFAGAGPLAWCVRVLSAGVKPRAGCAGGRAGCSGARGDVPR